MSRESEDIQTFQGQVQKSKGFQRQVWKSLKYIKIPHNQKAHESATFCITMGHYVINYHKNINFRINVDGCEPNWFM